MTAPAVVPAAASLPPPPARVHFVGIGGIGMSGLARILGAWGYSVSGSDASASELTAALAGEGIAVDIGHTATANAAGADLVVITAAVRPGNPEIAAAAAAGVPTVKRAALLGLLANARTCVAVAGSHGKSTTSGMLVTALQGLGGDPSYAVGAVVATSGTNAAPGTGQAMVVEADEYDYSFLALTPDVAVVTNIDYDHPDLFPDQTAYDDAFARFVANLRPGGRLIVAGDDAGCRRLLGRVSPEILTSLTTFGEDENVDWRLVGTPDRADVVAPNGDVVSLRLAVPGRHNARNAVAALAAAVALGHDPRQAADALAAFRGVGRRFERKGEAGGITVIDDYAHHPSELRATLGAAREAFPGRRIVAGFQPHTYSRTKALLDDFAASFVDADLAVILDIYPARETDSLGISAADLIARVPGGALAGGPAAGAAAFLRRLVEPGDVVLTLGAGDVTSVGPALLARLTESETHHG